MGFWAFLRISSTEIPNDIAAARFARMQGLLAPSGKWQTRSPGACWHKGLWRPDRKIDQSAKEETNISQKKTVVYYFYGLAAVFLRPKYGDGHFRVSKASFEFQISTGCLFNSMNLYLGTRGLQGSSTR